MSGSGFRSGRHLPAHLDVGPKPDYFATGQRGWWGWHRVAWPLDDVPDNIYWKRPNPNSRLWAYGWWDDVT